MATPCGHSRRPGKRDRPGTGSPPRTCRRRLGGGLDQVDQRPHLVHSDAEVEVADRDHGGSAFRIHHDLHDTGVAYGHDESLMIEDRAAARASGLPQVNCTTLLFCGVTSISSGRFGRNALMVPSLKVAIGTTSKGSVSSPGEPQDPDRLPYPQLGGEAAWQERWHVPRGQVVDLEHGKVGAGRFLFIARGTPARCRCSAGVCGTPPSAVPARTATGTGTKGKGSSASSIISRMLRNASAT